METEQYHTKLRRLLDEYAHFVYKITQKLPREEIYGVTSQLRRSALSATLNYIEGYARIRDKTYRSFLEIAYGSLKESKYLLEFAYKENYLTKEEYTKATKIAENIGAMLWGIMRKINN
ncbi:MAG: four helix bundle protein [Candidatus Wildermuthbacteria bacterium]|nr:four helix bundle protein [Candidatus Wildermuthbacteria bacterium]